MFALTKAERRARTDQNILEAAIEVFAEYGYERAAISNIAARAGISNGLIIQNFGCKLDLFKAILNNLFPFLKKAYSHVSGNHWEEYLIALVRFLKDSSQNEKTRMCFCFAATMCASKDTPACYREKAEAECSHDAAAEAMLQGQQLGEIKDGNISDLYALFFRVTCITIANCNAAGVALPPDEWFLQLVRK